MITWAAGVSHWHSACEGAIPAATTRTAALPAMSRARRREARGDVVVLVVVLRRMVMALFPLLLKKCGLLSRAWRSPSWRAVAVVLVSVMPACAIVGALLGVSGCG